MKAGWQTKTLGEVCQFRGGGTPSKAIEHYWSGDIPWVSPKDMKFDVVSDSIDHISPEAIKGSATSLIPKNSVLIVVRSGILARTVPIAVTGRDLTINQDLKALSPNGVVDARFLYHLLASKMDILLSMVSRGATVHRLMTEQIRSLDFLLPPLPEQQRIVGILDEAFDGIATAKANAERNLQNARALFESHLQAVFTQRGEGWVEKRFDELIESNIIGLTKSSREQGDDKAWRYVKMNNITRDNRFDFSSCTAVDATDEEVRKFHLKDGDFLFNTRNSFELVGKSCIYEADSGEVVLFNNNIMRIRFVGAIDARFVLLAFSSKVVAEELNALKSGTTNVSAIYYKDLKSLIIPVPPISAQKMIAIELDALRSETQRLESIYQRKLAALDKLKKSLLHQAFSGNL